jgi:isoleucyl-tRNA synthetase
VSPDCPRCATVLSSHEVAQGYKTTEDPSIFVKFKVQGQSDVYFLVWTTTPWTLPANVALAVNENLEYAKIYFYTTNETFILARDALKNIEGNFDVVGGYKGSQLVGMRYEPLYNFITPDKPAYKVFADDFVSSQEGTGIVHIAPAFGIDDFELAKKYDLPVLITIDDQGKFIDLISVWKGKFVKEADELIIEDLKKRKMLYKSGTCLHEYPFCWRCKSPLIYFAQSSWFVKISSIKDKLLANNEKINWHPEHQKYGRFGKWLSEVKDWAFSRKRYWGTPLPIWTCRQCNHIEVVSSYNDLKQKNFFKNTFYFLRHCQALSNQKNLLSSGPREKFFNPLTKSGVTQAKKLARQLKKEKIDIIFSSELLRARQTAEIIAKHIKVKVNFDSRLNEISFGALDGQSIKVWQDLVKDYKDFLTAKPQGGESRLDVRKRVLDFIEEINKKYKNKKILIVSHGDTIWMAETALLNLSLQEIINFNESQRLKVGAWRKFEPVKLPQDSSGKFDPHRPFIDRIILGCARCGGIMTRVEELADVWFDSGAMPLAQMHFPFAQTKNLKFNLKSLIKKIPYPADYIAEGVDQTRGWFYTLLAVSSALDIGPSYRNVISLGLVLDAKGQKMSKSLGNIVSPSQAIEKFSADGIRWFFYTSSTPGTSKRYDEQVILLSLRKFLLTYLNIVQFFELYPPSKKLDPDFIYKNSKKFTTLERWVISNFFKLLKEVTQYLESFKITSASRKLQDFVVTDFSQWYLRNSREFIPSKPEVFYSILWNVNKILAPFIPFTTEDTFQKLKKYAVKKTEISVHLENWPRLKNKIIDENLLEAMKQARDIVSLGMKQRKEKNIKVRQPLNKVLIWVNDEKLMTNEILEIIKQQLNVKEAQVQKNNLNELKVELDTTLTQDLIEEGKLRDLLRDIQNSRKILKLKPDQKIILLVNKGSETEKLVKKFSSLIKNKINIKKIDFKKIKEDFKIYKA